MNLDKENILSQIQNKNLRVLSKLFTKAESSLEEDINFINDLLSNTYSRINNSIVISISGIPGVGKSTFINKFVKLIHANNFSTVVFCIDPSSQYSNGSILADKTRMSEIANLENVLVRPSPNNLNLGGLGSNTHKNIEIAKIANYDFIIVETVGVGQSEIIAKNIADIFVLLMMPASGDDFQLIKKGILEEADFFIINKADNELLTKAIELKNSLLFSKENDINSLERVFLNSSLQENGLNVFLSNIQKIIMESKYNKIFEKNRLQNLAFWYEYDINNQISKYFIDKHKNSIDINKQNILSKKFNNIKLIDYNNYE